MNALRRLMCNPRLLQVGYSAMFRSAARTFRLLPAVRHFHHRSVVAADGVYQTWFHGVPARFRARTMDELRCVENRALILEKATLDVLLRELRAGDIFLDIGADVGVFTMLAAAAIGEAGQVIAFEPEAKAFDRLQDNVSLNGLRNVRAFRVALGEETAEGRLYVSPAFCPSLLRGEEQGLHVQCELVEVVKGDEFWKLHDLPVPQVTKVDVEGFEDAVLKGLEGTLSDPRARLLLCEIHPTLLPRGTTADAVRDLIRSLGFADCVEFPRREEIHVVARKQPSRSATL